MAKISLVTCEKCGRGKALETRKLTQLELKREAIEKHDERQRKKSEADNS